MDEAQRTALKQIEALKSIIETQEREREYLSIELLNSVEQFLSVLPSTFADCQKLIGKHPQKAQEYLNFYSQRSQIVLDDLMAIRHSLWPRALADYGLARALRALVAFHQKKSAIQFQLDIEDKIDLALPKEKITPFYRMLQQIIERAALQSNAALALISLELAKSSIVFTVETKEKRVKDNYIAKTDDDFFQIMRYRAAMLGGEITFTARPAENEIIRGWIPFFQEIED